MYANSTRKLLSIREPRLVLVHSCGQTAIFLHHILKTTTRGLTVCCLILFSALAIPLVQPTLDGGVLALGKPTFVEIQTNGTLLHSVTFCISCVLVFRTIYSPNINKFI